MSDNGRVSGTIKWYNTTKGFGFIQMSGQTDIFCHANQLRKSGIARALTEGEKVSFVISNGPKGKFAIEIQLEK